MELTLIIVVYRFTNLWPSSCLLWSILTEEWGGVRGAVCRGLCSVMCDRMMSWVWCSPRWGNERGAVRLFVVLGLVCGERCAV